MSLFKESPYNQRQFRQMLWTLENYEKRQITLGSMIARLEGLLGCLEGTEQQWVDEFTHCWGILEEAYAGALYRTEITQSKLSLDQQELELISNAIGHLKALIISGRSLCT